MNLKAFLLLQHIDAFSPKKLCTKNETIAADKSRRRDTLMCHS